MLIGLNGMRIRNSRMKDFYDVWHLAKTREFELIRLRDAFGATFERRQTRLPTEVPFALTEAFLRNELKTEQWGAFVKRLHLDGVPKLPEVGAAITRFLEPVLRIDQLRANWPAGGPWRG